MCTHGTGRQDVSLISTLQIHDEDVIVFHMVVSGLLSRCQFFVFFSVIKTRSVASCHLTCGGGGSTITIDDCRNWLPVLTSLLILLILPSQLSVAMATIYCVAGGIRFLLALSA